MKGLNLKIYQIFVWGQNFFLQMLGDKPLWVGIKIILLQFHYFISLEAANTQKSEMFLLKFLQES